MPIYVREGATTAQDQVTVSGFTATAPNATGLNGTYVALNAADTNVAIGQISAAASTRYDPAGTSIGQIVPGSVIYGTGSHLLWNRNDTVNTQGGWHITARNNNGVWARMAAQGDPKQAAVNASFPWAKINAAAQPGEIVTPRTNVPEATGTLAEVFNQQWSGDPNVMQPARFIELNSRAYYDFTVRIESTLECGPETSDIFIESQQIGFAPQFQDASGNDLPTGNIELIGNATTSAPVAGLSGAGAGTDDDNGITVIHNVGGVALNTTLEFPDSVNGSGFAGGRSDMTGVNVNFVDGSIDVGDTFSVDVRPCPRSSQAGVVRTVSGRYLGEIGGNHVFDINPFSAPNCQDFSGFFATVGRTVVRSVFSVNNTSGRDFANFQFTAGGTTTTQLRFNNGDQLIHEAVQGNTDNGWAWVASNPGSGTESHTVELMGMGAQILNMHFMNSDNSMHTMAMADLNFPAGETCIQSTRVTVRNGTTEGRTPVDPNFVEEMANTTLTIGGDQGGTVRQVDTIYVNDNGTIREVVLVFENDAGTPREIFGPTLAPIAPGTSVTPGTVPNSPGPAGSDAVNPDPSSAACADITGNATWQYGGRSACCCSQKISGFRASVWPGEILSFETQNIEYGRVRFDIHGGHGCGNCCDCCQRQTFSRCFYAPHPSFQFPVSRIFNGRDFIQGATNADTQSGGNFVFTFNPDWNDGTTRARDWRPFATSGGFSGCCGDAVRVGLVYDFNDPTTWNFAWGGCKSTNIGLTPPSTSIGSTGSGGRPCGGGVAFIRNDAAIQVFQMP